MSRERPLTLEELRLRMKGARAEVVLPPSASIEDLSLLHPEDLRDLHPERYRHYLELLRRYRSKSERSSSPTSKSSYPIHWLRFMNALDRYIFENKDNPERVLRAKQFQALDHIREFFEAGELRGYIQLPTGVGKTVLFVELIKATNARTLVVVPTKDLVTQTLERLRTFSPETSVGAHYSGQKTPGNTLVTTYDSLLIGLRSGAINPENFDLLVLDEAHEALSDLRTQALDRFPVPIIGFTATPAYSKRKHIRSILEKEIFRLELPDAIKDGYLCGVRSFIAETQIDLSSVPLEGGEYQDAQLTRALESAGLTKAVVSLYQKTFQNEQALVYCAGVQHAQDVARAFTEAGISAEAIYGSMNDRDRERAIERYLRGEIMVLTNDKVLTAGFDAPAASVCMNLAPTKSPVRALQRAGRVLRLNPQNEQKIATVVDFTYTDTRHPTAIFFPHILGGAFLLPEYSPSLHSAASSSHTSHTPSPLPPSVHESSFSIDNLVVHVNAEEIMRITGTSSEKEPRFMNMTEAISALRTLLGSYSFHALRNDIEKMKRRTDRVGSLARESANFRYTGIAPELFDAIRASYPEAAPGGWKSANALTRDFGASTINLQRAIEKWLITKNISANVLESRESWEPYAQDFNNFIRFARHPHRGQATFFFSPTLQSELQLLLEDHRNSDRKRLANNKRTPPHT